MSTYRHALIVTVDNGVAVESVTVHNVVAVDNVVAVESVTVHNVVAVDNVVAVESIAVNNCVAVESVAVTCSRGVCLTTRIKTRQSQHG
jgi:hypothetical protein